MTYLRLYPGHYRESEPPRKLQLVQLVTRLKFEPGISSNKIGDSAAVHRITQANR
jgi:hypothetical protein